VRAGQRVDLAASDRDARRIALRGVERPGDPPLQEALSLDCRQPQRLVLERTLTRPDGIAAKLSATGSDAGELLRQIVAVPPARQFSEGPGWVIARSYEVWTRSRGDELFMERALIAVEGLRCELALRLPNLRSVAGDIRIEAAPGHRLDLPEDLLAVLGWDWVRLERKRDAWVSKLRLRGAALARSARAERALERAAPHLARVLEETPAQFHQRHLAARWGVMLRRSIPTATALGMIGGALLLPRLFDAQARAGLAAYLGLPQGGRLLFAEGGLGPVGRVGRAVDGLVALGLRHRPELRALTEGIAAYAALARAEWAGYLPDLFALGQPGLGSVLLHFDGAAWAPATGVLSSVFAAGAGAAGALTLGLARNVWSYQASSGWSATVLPSTPGIIVDALALPSGAVFVLGSSGHLFHRP